MDAGTCSRLAASALRNGWKPDQCLHIESGELQSGAVEPGWLSAMWIIEYEG